MSGYRGTYAGPIRHLDGKTALIRYATHGYVVAQFDDMTLTKSGTAFDPTAAELSSPPEDALGYGWHAFPQSHFLLDPES